MKVVVAMSGGVDSSTAAALLKEQGYEVIGITMKLWDNGVRCCSIDDIYDAKRVAAQLGIPHYTLNFKEQFQNKVVEYFVTEYLMGRTPNPCVVCNKEIKFNLLLQKAEQLGAKYLATGHYARIEQRLDRFILKIGKEKVKDQSYFLSMITQEKLGKILFPLSNYTKEEVRVLASKLRLKVAEKAESQEICFIPDGDYAKFIRERHTLEGGTIVNKNGKLLGYHNGIVNYTIGQRRGIGIPADKPFYVIGIDPMKNRVIVGSELDLYSKGFIAKHPNWIAVKEQMDLCDGCRKRQNSQFEVDVKIRYHQSPTKAVITWINPDQIVVQFKEPQKAVTPGQLAVFYQGDEVIGSAWIESTATTVE